jgi:hypothetical protein
MRTKERLSFLLQRKPDLITSTTFEIFTALLISMRYFFHTVLRRVCDTQIHVRPTCSSLDILSMKPDTAKLRLLYQYQYHQHRKEYNESSPFSSKLYPNTTLFTYLLTYIYLNYSIKNLYTPITTKTFIDTII